jgi:hypothetical protein
MARQHRHGGLRSGRVGQEKMERCRLTGTKIHIVFVSRRRSSSRWKGNETMTAPLVEVVSHRRENRSGSYRVPGIEGEV